MQTFAEGIHRRTLPFAHEVVTAHDGERLSPSLPKPSDLSHVWSVAGLSQGPVSAWAKCQCVKSKREDKLRNSEDSTSQDLQGV